MDTESARPRLLVYSDSPTAPTGMARLTRAVIGHLASEYEIAVLGWGFDGRPHPYGVHIYPCEKRGRHVVGQVVEVVKEVRPDIILCMGDPWDFVHMPELVPQLRRNVKAGLKWYFLALIDGDPLMKEWLPVFTMCDGLSVTSAYGQKMINALEESLHPPVVRLGVDAEFWKVDGEHTLTIAESGPVPAQVMSRSKQFVVLFVGVNSSRKNIDALLQAATPLLKAHDDAYLWLHITYDTPSGMDVFQIAGHLGTPGKQLKVSRPSRPYGSTDAEIKQYYSIATVVACTSLGEGNWLPGYEAQACGCIPVGIDATAVPETIGGRGILVPVAYAGQFGEWGFRRYFVDVKKFTEALEDLYQDWKNGCEKINYLRKVGRRWAGYHSWERFADGVRALLAQERFTDAPAVKRAWVREKVDMNVVRAAMICPTFGKNCGIGEYSVALCRGMQDACVFPKTYATKEIGRIPSVCDEEKLDLVHIQHEYMFYKPLDMDFAFRKIAANGTACVTTMHTVTAGHPQNQLILAGNAAVIVHSEAQKELLLSCGEKGNVVVMPMGAPAPPLYNRDRLRAKHGYGPNDFVIGSYGFLRNQKGYDILINAMPHLPENVKLMIFASKHEFGSNAYDEKVMSYIEKVGVQDRVQLIRDRLDSKTQVVNLLQVADVLALLYRDFESVEIEQDDGSAITRPTSIGVSSALKDCAAAGRPLVLARTAPFSDVPEDVACWVEPEHHMPFVEAVKQLMADEGRMAELAVAARKFAWDRRWENVGRLHAELYVAILEGRKWYPEF